MTLQEILFVFEWASKIITAGLAVGVLGLLYFYLRTGGK